VEEAGLEGLNPFLSDSGESAGSVPFLPFFWFFKSSSHSLLLSTWISTLPFPFSPSCKRRGFHWLNRQHRHGKEKKEKKEKKVVVTWFLKFLCSCCLDQEESNERSSELLKALFFLGNKKKGIERKKKNKKMKETWKKKKKEKRKKKTVIFISFHFIFLSSKLWTCKKHLFIERSGSGSGCHCQGEWN